MKEVKFYEAVESCGSGDEWRLYRTYDKDEAMRAAKHYKSKDSRYKIEVREYTLPHPVEDLKGFDDPDSDTYDATIDDGEVFGFYNYEEVE